MPWETVVPKRIVNLEAISREGHLLLEWTLPKENTDNSVLTDLAEVQGLRSEGDLIAGECRGCGGKPTVVYEMKFSEKEEVRGKRMSIVFENLEPKKVYVYQVVSVNRRGYPSAPSNPATVYWDNPPPPPRVVRGERGDKRVDLLWEPAETATGYNVYRREEGQVFSPNPLNKEPLTETHYIDLNVVNERKYIYSVRGVRRVVKTDVEGKGSLDVPVTPTKLTPPSAPTGLVAIPLKDGIELSWRRSQDPDLLGYYVYRRKPGEEKFKRLTKNLLEKETYLDTDVEAGQDYEYGVTGVDNSVNRNESTLSEEVRVKYLF